MNGMDGIIIIQHSISFFPIERSKIQYSKNLTCKQENLTAEQKGGCYYHRHKG